MSERDQTPDDQWPRGWEAHELEQARRLAKLSLSEKLDWLEQARRVVLQLAQSRAAQPAPAPDNPNSQRP
jgi:hypothetical protein